MLPALKGPEDLREIGLAAFHQAQAAEGNPVVVDRLKGVGFICKSGVPNSRITRIRRTTRSDSASLQRAVLLSRRRVVLSGTTRNSEKVRH